MALTQKYLLVVFLNHLLGIVLPTLKALSVERGPVKGPSAIDNARMS